MDRLFPIEYAEYLTSLVEKDDVLIDQAGPTKLMYVEGVLRCITSIRYTTKTKVHYIPFMYREFRVYIDYWQ